MLAFLHENLWKFNKCGICTFLLYPHSYLSWEVKQNMSTCDNFFSEVKLNINAKWAGWALNCFRGSASRAATLACQGGSHRGCGLWAESWWGIGCWSEGGEQGDAWHMVGLVETEAWIVVIKTLVLGMPKPKVGVSVRARFPTTSKKYSVSPGSETLGAFYTFLGTCHPWEFVELLWSLWEDKGYLCSLQAAFVIVSELRSPKRNWELLFFSAWVLTCWGWFFPVVASLLSLHTWIPPHFPRETELGAQNPGRPSVSWYLLNPMKTISLTYLLTKL